MNRTRIVGGAMAALAAVGFAAAAVAQTPSPTGTVAPSATGTTASTPILVPTAEVPPGLYTPGGGDYPFAHPAFERVWDRTDHVVQLGQVQRTWFWGPGPNTPGLVEQYNEGAGRSRLVQYFDKSRMELNNPQGNQQNPFFVTNGLLTVELISGFVQVGEKDFVQYRAACIPMSGDPIDGYAPTYKAFQGVSNTQAGDHPAPNRTGQKVTETIDRQGTTGTDPSKANMPGVELVHFAGETKHNIPKVFWDFLNSTGPTHDPGHVVRNQALIQPWFFASGLPISEAYWAKATIQGQVRDVLIQAFERRALTFVPTNPQGFQVEMANIGQHYFDWRYRNAGACPGDVIGTPTPPVPAPTSQLTPQVTTTAVVTGTVTAVPSATACANCPSPTPTITFVVPPGTVVDATHTVVPTAAPTGTPTATPTP
jgi:hypothetical protein